MENVHIKKLIQKAKEEALDEVAEKIKGKIGNAQSMAEEGYTSKEIADYLFSQVLSILKNI